MTVVDDALLEILFNYISCVICLNLNLSVLPALINKKKHSIVFNLITS